MIPEYIQKTMMNGNNNLDVYHFKEHPKLQIATFLNIVYDLEFLSKYNSPSIPQEEVEP